MPEIVCVPMRKGRNFCEPFDASVEHAESPLPREELRSVLAELNRVALAVRPVTAQISGVAWVSICLLACASFMLSARYEDADGDRMLAAVILACFPGSLMLAVGARRLGVRLGGAALILAGLGLLMVSRLELPEAPPVQPATARLETADEAYAVFAFGAGTFAGFVDLCMSTCCMARSAVRKMKGKVAELNMRYSTRGVDFELRQSGLLTNSRASDGHALIVQDVAVLKA